MRDLYRRKEAQSHCQKRRHDKAEGRQGARERFEDATMLALKMKKETTSQGMQAASR